jgi:hypothetical protein
MISPSAWARSLGGVLGCAEDAGCAVGAVPVASVTPDHRGEECTQYGVLVGVGVDELGGDVASADGVGSVSRKAACSGSWAIEFGALGWGGVRRSVDGCTAG